MFDKKIKMNKGESITETLFYIALFAILSILVINSLLTMMKSFKGISVQRELVQNGTIMETMSREIRKAYSVNSITSSDLTLNTRDDAGNSKTVQFVLSGTDLLLKENTTFTGNLNSSDVSVVGIVFTQITTVKGVAIKISLSVASKSDITNVKNFYDTIVLRGNY